MTFDNAMKEAGIEAAEVEAACARLNLSDHDRAFVMERFREGDGALFRKVMEKIVPEERYVGYVQIVMAMRDGVANP